MLIFRISQLFCQHFFRLFIVILTAKSVKISKLASRCCFIIHCTNSISTMFCFVSTYGNINWENIRHPTDYKVTTYLMFVTCKVWIILVCKLFVINNFISNPFCSLLVLFIFVSKLTFTVLPLKQTELFGTLCYRHGLRMVQSRWSRVRDSMSNQTRRLVHI